jgi:tetrahydromethanopterin S-methyltransferase subunit E
MNINFEAFLDSLPIMGFGMIGIFTVIVIIYILILGLNKVFHN